MKRNNLKLLTMLLALVVSVTAIVGGTVAFFVDEAAVTYNGQGENLDLELSYYDGADWVAIDNREEKNAVLLTEPENIAEYEPGYTRVVHLKLRNAGSMALKYKLDAEINNTQLGTNIDDEDIYQLSDHLKAVAIPASEEDFSNITRDDVWAHEVDTNYLTATYYDAYRTSPTEEPAAGTAENSFVVNLPMNDESEFVLYPENNLPTDVEGAVSEQYITVAIWMPTEVSNEANYKTATAAEIEEYMTNNTEATEDEAKLQHRATISMNLKASATQYTYEIDFEDDQYDESATLGETSEDSGNQEGDNTGVGGSFTGSPFTGISWVEDVAGEVTEADTGWAVEGYSASGSVDVSTIYKYVDAATGTQHTGPIVKLGVDDRGDTDAIVWSDVTELTLGSGNYSIMNRTLPLNTIVHVNADTTLYGTERSAFGAAMYAGDTDKEEAKALWAEQGLENESDVAIVKFYITIEDGTTWYETPFAQSLESIWDMSDSSGYVQFYDANGTRL